jgi:hypothetical protein
MRVSSTLSPATKANIGRRGRSALIQEAPSVIPAEAGIEAERRTLWPSLGSRFRGNDIVAVDAKEIRSIRSRWQVIAALSSGIAPGVRPYHLVGDASVKIAN